MAGPRRHTVLTLPERRIALKRAYADGTVAVELDPLSLLCRLATSVPPPRFHQVKYAGVLASASPWRARIAPKPAEPPEPPAAKKDDAPPPRRWNGYRPWAELLTRICPARGLRPCSELREGGLRSPRIARCALDVLECPRCGGRMKLVAMVTEPASVRRFLAKLGAPTDVAARSPNRGPPFWKSIVLRRKAGARDEG